MTTNPDGAQLITEERERQKTAEGWAAEHDDRHDGGELAMAAVCYAYPHPLGRHALPPAMWPWDRRWWKPTGDRVRQLVKAGALIAAEIDRLRRGLTDPRQGGFINANEGETMPSNEAVPVGGVWLTSLNGRLRVLVEIDGVWRVAIDEARPVNADGTPYIVSHCANARGFHRWPADPVLADAR